MQSSRSSNDDLGAVFELAKLRPDVFSAGQNGNFAGAPVVNCELSFLTGSIGIDAGNSNAVDLGPADVSGAPRSDGITLRVHDNAYPAGLAFFFFSPSLASTP